MCQKLIAILKEPKKLIAKLNRVIIKQYPKLEDLTVTPSGQEQNFKSEKYGYNNVTVKAIESDILNVVPNEEVQKFEGMFNTVNLDKIDIEEKNIDLVFGNNNSVEIMPNDRKYIKKVTINKDDNLIPENIKEGVEIFGVSGSAELRGKENAMVKMPLKRGTSTNSALNECITKIFGDIELDDTSSAYMFTGCSNLEEVPLFDTSKVTYMNHMFYGCKKIANIPLFNTANVINTSYMFMNCIELITVPLFDTSNDGTMASMFNGCSKLEEVPLFNTAKVTNMARMFYSCSSLISVPLIDTLNVGDMTSMFSKCSNLEEVPAFNTSNVRYFKEMFSDCLKLTTIPLLDSEKIVQIDGVVSNCSNLMNIGGFKDLGKAYTQKSSNYGTYTLNLSKCTKLTHESLMNVINNLYDLNLTYDVANGGTLYKQTLNLGSTNKAKLTEEEIAIATNKGWNVT